MSDSRPMPNQRPGHRYHHYQLGTFHGSEVERMAVIRSQQRIAVGGATPRRLRLACRESHAGTPVQRQPSPTRRAPPPFPSLPYSTTPAGLAGPKKKSKAGMVLTLVTSSEPKYATIPSLGLSFREFSGSLLLFFRSLRLLPRDLHLDY